MARRRAARTETEQVLGSTMAPAVDDLGPELSPPRRGNRERWSVDMACSTMETDPAWAGVLAFDELLALPVLLRPIPGSRAPRSSFKPRPLRDDDITAGQRWFNRAGHPNAPRAAIADALAFVAGQRVLSPIRDYLESLKWDGKPRVADWLERYCGVAPSNFARKAGQAWLVSAVARALEPGCKADCALVLEGQQGAGKSSALRILAGEAWFYDGLADLHTKDASQALRGKWVVELPELAAMRRSDIEATKAFLSRTEERYRPPYARTEVIEPRRCVFAGTTNRGDYLNDETGGRRFWPVTVGVVRLADLGRDRDQLWAEAVVLYRSGTRWWLNGADEKEAAQTVASRASDDPWTADVLQALTGKTECSTRDILEKLNIPLERRGKPEAMRVAAILTRAGWQRRGKFTSGRNRDLARYVAPAADERE